MDFSPSADIKKEFNVDDRVMSMKDFYDVGHARARTSFRPSTFIATVTLYEFRLVDRRKTEILQQCELRNRVKSI